ncbi:uncharacterized protein [Nicotiana tomentosiformis]|uniref:uncharacterized protein n=1 Tax=Nicotiana tomentosiformis TaxID=4098 RepID=UPI00388C643B
MEVYKDNVLVKSLNPGNRLKHLQETFDVLRKHNMKHNPEKFAFRVIYGRLAKWAVEMSEFDVEYKPRTTIKSQVLADFVADFSPGLLPLATKEAVMVSESTSGVWTLFTYGASNDSSWPVGLNSEVIEIKCDFQLVVNQVYGIFDAKEEHMQQYVVEVQALLARFREWSITHILREENMEADALANLGTSTEMKRSDSGKVVQLMHSVLDVDSYY